MKRLVFYVGMMLVTFALGVGTNTLFSQQRINFNPPPIAETVSLAPVELLKEQVPPIPPVPAATPEPILVLDYDPERFTPWAVFYIMGRKPKAFADVDSLEVALSGHVEAGEGYIQVNTCTPDVACEPASATFALVTERRLFFVTTQLRNSEFEYRFDGQFLRTDFNAVEGKKIAVLRGTLTKTKHGRKIAEHTFNFRMEHLGC
jgi:hypothetical protein